MTGWIRTTCVFAIATLLLTTNGHAIDDQEDVAATIRELRERIIALEGEVRQLKATQTAQTGAAVAPTTAAEVPVGRTTVTTEQQPVAGTPEEHHTVLGGATGFAKALNPDIGVIGNFVAATGRNSVNPLPALSLQESEVSLQAVVDPYARADFFLAFGETGVEVEEGYVTFTSIPGGFVPRIGKMRAAFGRVNTFHNHTLPWVDRPMVAFNLMGGSLEEADVGIKDAGVSITRALPSLRGIYFEGTAQVFRGDSGSLFTSSTRSDVSTVGHLKGYRDISETTNLELGASYARGHNDLGSAFITQLYAADATLRWKPVKGFIHHSFSARSEFVWSQREELSSQQRAFGYFVSAEYQLGRRWFTGARYDWSERAKNALQYDSGGSLVLTYWPSEFSQLRGQLRRTQYAEGKTANELLMQVLFTVGAHGAHPF